MLWGRPGVGLWAARPLVREPSLVLVWTSGGPFVAVVAASLVGLWVAVAAVVE